MLRLPIVLPPPRSGPFDALYPVDLVAPSPTLPLCSFGPGGSYVVDWQVHTDDIQIPGRVFPPRTLASLLRRFSGWILWDLKGWLIADHPSRAHRIDSHPATLAPCETCGLSDSWPRWFVAGLSSPASLEARLTYGAAAAALRQPKGVFTAAESTEDFGEDPMVFPFPRSADLEMVPNLARSPVGVLLARLAATSRQKHEARPGASSSTESSTREFAAETAPEELALLTGPNTECSHDPNPQTAQDSRIDPRLSSPQRLFADHAGTRGPNRRVKGNHLRAHRSARTKGPDSAGPEQGSLFGSLADDQAA